MRLLALFLIVPVVTIPRLADAFSVLAHQGIVDSAWNDSVAPEIRRRFPQASDDELEQARAFAYGGSHVADLGYFPLGSKLFTGLVHYERTGQFIRALLTSATNADEYAFALGALEHWVGDSVGHPEATNRAVAVIYPKLRKKYGDSVTYAEDHSAHLTTEFRFDVFQMSRSKQTRDLFRHSLEFEVPQRVLNAAFERTYGLPLDDIFESTDVAIGTYRWAFRGLIHEATGIAWEIYREDIHHVDPEATAKSFVYDVPRADFEEEFGSAFKEPGYFARVIAWIVNLVPKVGPFKRAPYSPLPDEARRLFVTGSDHAVAKYRAAVAQLPGGRLELPDTNLDVGKRTARGEYEPADETYDDWQAQLRKHGRVTPPPVTTSLETRSASPGGPGGARGSGRERRGPGHRAPRSRRRVSALGHRGGTS